MSKQENKYQNGKVESKKINLLWYGDIATHTGFGKVTEEILTRLHKTELYDISVLGLNYRGDFHPLQRIFKIFPVSDSDLWGQSKMMPLIKNHIQPDILVTLNDIDCLIWYKEQRDKYIDKTRWLWYAPLDSSPNHPAALDCLMSCDRFITFTKWGREQLRNQVTNMPVDVIPHGTDTNKFHKINDPGLQQKKCEIFRHPNPYVVGSVGRNQYRKEFPRLLEAFKIFAKDKPHAFLFLHTCPRDNAPGFPLPELIDKLGLQGRVLFPRLANGGHMTPGHGVSEEELNLYYNMMDVMVLPSNAGGWELPLTESLAAGTPVITTDYAAMQEVAGNGRGLLVPIVTEYWFVGTNLGRKGIVDIPKLADAMQLMYKDKQDGGKIGNEIVRRGQEFVNKYNWDFVANEFHRLIQEEVSIGYKEQVRLYSARKNKFSPCREYPFSTGSYNEVLDKGYVNPSY